MTVMFHAGEPPVSVPDPIALGAQLDDIRLIIPTPEVAGMPEMTYRRRTPDYRWLMVDAAGQKIGFLCDYVSGEAEEIGVWIYGENRARAQRWSFKRVPEFRSAIAANGLKDRPEAVIVALGPQQTAVEALPRVDRDGELVPVVVTFDTLQARPTKARGQSFGSPVPVSLAGQHLGDPAPSLRPVAEEEAHTCSQIRDDVERPRVPSSPARRSQRDGVLADRAEKPRQPPVKAAPRSGSQSAAPESLEQPQTVKMLTVRAADVEQQPVSWLWPDRIPLGKLTLIVGDPGLGKSLLGAYLAAAVSQGAPWPISEDPAPKGSVLLISTEDDTAGTIKPRLHTAGADMRAVHLFEGMEHGSRHRGLDLTRDMEALEHAATEFEDLKLIVIDPITACLGGANQNTAGAVRAVMTVLADFAARTGVAVVVISHLNKSPSRSAMMRATGALAFVAVARAAFLVIKHPSRSDRRLFLPIKSNLGADLAGLSFRVESVRIGTGTAPRLVFDPEPAAMTADDALNEARSNNSSRPALEEAKDFLRDYLADGAIPASDIHAAAKAAGISLASLRRAKSDLGITPKKVGMTGEWRWSLPEDPKALEPAEDAHSHTMSTFEEDDHLRSGDDAWASQQKAGQHEG